MKTLALYAMLMGAGLMTVPSDASPERQLFYAPLQSAELVLTDDLFSTENIKMHTVPATINVMRKKEYHIYYENRSEEAIEVALRYKSVSGQWQTRGLMVLAPG